MMLENAADPVTFSPDLAAADPWANHWIRQVTVRLRREMCWRQRPDAVSRTVATAPPSSADRIWESLDLTRYSDARRTFFATHPTARYLSTKLTTEPPAIDGELARGSFGWVVWALDLDEVSAFVLALGLTPSFDSAAGPVMAACLNDLSQPHPTLALAQRLWDRPEHVLPLADPAHPLWRYGLLQTMGHAGQPEPVIDWEAPVGVAPLVAHALLFPGASAPEVLAPLGVGAGDSAREGVARLIVDWLRSAPADGLRIVPVRGARGSPYAEVVQGLASAAGRQVCRLNAEPALLENPSYLKSLVTLAWLKGLELFIPSDVILSAAGDRHRPYTALAALRSVPATVFLRISEYGELTLLPRDLLLPTVDVPRLTYPDRVAHWSRSLGRKACGLEQAIAECARRFRYEKETISAICVGLQAQRDPLRAADLVAACRAEVPLDAGELAQPVTPRFAAHELILPHNQRLQLEEIYQAMKSLTEVHYGWGTARVWNESGISVLFAGPPGTGKTMAAEVLAARLDMPMYRIDLSQVVNKYIGETEKNLKRLFDLADVADTILFFDEADALFGRRTEVRDAHDRYANLEISYLLERMERFKGLAILATNRRKDLDEAFLRRLRYIVEFPLPEAAQRRAIWQQVIPANVDASLLDLDFLAEQFPLAGGHIRSVVFNACLQTAGGAWPGGEGARPPLTMERVIVAVKREYDKLKRSVSLEQFGPYASIVEGLEHA